MGVTSQLAAAAVLATSVGLTSSLKLVLDFPADDENHQTGRPVYVHSLRPRLETEHAQTLQSMKMQIKYRFDLFFTFCFCIIQYNMFYCKHICATCV